MSKKGGGVKAHPYAEIFPLLDDVSLNELAEDIRANGLREPIWLFEGKVLDGRNRLAACRLAGVEPMFNEFEGDEETALAFVWSTNRMRRHLTTSQRSMAAARYATLKNGSNQHQAKTEEGGSFDPPSVTIGQAARDLNVSRASAKRARKVVEKGSAGLQAAVDSGEVSVTKAATVVDLPPEQQLEAAKAPTSKPAEPAHDPDSWAADWQPKINQEEIDARAETERQKVISNVRSRTEGTESDAKDREIARLTAEIAIVKASRDNFMREKNSLVVALRAEQRKVRSMAKKLEKVGGDCELLGERVAIMEEH